VFDIIANRFCFLDGSTVEQDEMEDADLIDDNWAIDVESFDAENHMTTIEKEEITNTLDKCRALIRLIKRSSILMQFIQETKQPFGINRQFVLDCITRWNSTNYMIETFLLHKRVLLTLFDQKRVLPITKSQKDRLTDLEFSTDQWEILSILYRVLEPFADATTFLSGSKYPTIGLCLFTIRTLQEYLERDNSHENPTTGKMRALLAMALQHYFDQNNEQFRFLKVRASNVSRDYLCFFSLTLT
jgi:hypothetical protein